MKLLLDAHISGRTVGKALTERGHDMRALDSEPELEGLSDPEILELAAAEGRILVTANTRDFEPLLREWAGESRPHAGVILVPSRVRNETFGVLITGLRARPDLYPIGYPRRRERARRHHRAEELQAGLRSEAPHAADRGATRRTSEGFRGEEIQVIVLPTRVEQSETFKERLGAEVKSFNLSRSKVVVDICTTFEKLIGSFGNTLADHDYEMHELLEDYEAFCFEEDVLPREDRWMRAVPCGKTLEDNLALGLYYQPASRSSREHRYLGVYKNKRVQGIGKIDNVVVADLSDDGLEIHDRSDREKPVSQEQRERIEKAIHNAREQYGYDIATGHKFFLVDEFHGTDFRKVSSGGLMAHRYFDLSNILETSPLPAIQEIANALRERTW